MTISRKLLAFITDPRRSVEYLYARLRGDHEVAIRIRAEYLSSSTIIREKNLRPIAERAIRVFPDRSNEMNAVLRDLLGSKFHFYMKLKASGAYVRSVAQGLPIQGEELLYAIVRLTRPTKIVETGVGPGVSTAYLLKALEDNQHGHLYSIDMPNMDQELHETSPEYGAEPQQKARQIERRTTRNLRPSGWLIPDELKQRWTLQVGLSSSLLPILLDEVGEIDLFLHDSAHTYQNMMFEFKSAWPHLRKGGILLSDDTQWNNAFADFARECSQNAIELDWFGIIIK